MEAIQRAVVPAL
jgi:hypothetical protein